MKKLLIAVVVLLVLAGAAVLILPRFFNAEAQRALISQKMEAALQRKVTLGAMRLTLFPPSIRIAGLEIAEAQGFGKNPFLTAEEVQVRVTLRPLLDGRLEVPSVTVAKPSIHLVKNAKGEWNYSTLFKAPVPKAKAAGAPAAAAANFNIGEVEIIDGALSVTDLSGKTKPASLDQVNLKLTHVAMGQPFGYQLSAHLPGKGKGLLTTDGEAGPLDPSPGANITAKGTAKLEEVDLSSIGSLVDQPGMAGLMSANATFSQDGKTMPVEGDYHITGLRLNPKGSPAQAPVSGKYKMRYAGDPDRLEIQNLALNCGQSVFNLTGKMDLARSVDNAMDLRTTNAQLPDAAKLLPALAIRLPAGSSISSGTLTGSTKLRGRFQPASGNAAIDIANARLAGYSFTRNLAAVAKLVGIPSGADTEIQKLAGTFNIDHGNFSSNDLQLVLPGMTVTGGGSMSEAGNLNLKMLAKLTGQSSAAGILQRAMMGKNEIQIPFFIQGTTERPVFVPDAAGMLRQQVEGRTGAAGAAGGGLGGILGGLFGKKK